MLRLNEDQRNDAIGRLKTGESRLAVAKVFNVVPDTIAILWNRYQLHTATSDLPTSGIPCVTTQTQNCYI